jgi:hypothetical protein
MAFSKTSFAVNVSEPVNASFIAQIYFKNKVRQRDLDFAGMRKSGAATSLSLTVDAHELHLQMRIPT